MENCKHFYETDGLLVRIVDLLKTRKDAVDYCQQFGEELAPINNWKRVNDTLDNLGNCYKTDVYGVRTGEVKSKVFQPHRIGYHVINGTGSWSDGTLLDLDKQESLFESGDMARLDKVMFYIHSNKLGGQLYTKIDYKIPFLCSKNKPITATAISSTTSLLISFSFLFALLLAVIIFMTYIIISQRNKINNLTKSSAAIESNEKEDNKHKIYDEHHYLMSYKPTFPVNKSVEECDKDKRVSFEVVYEEIEEVLNTQLPKENHVFTENKDELQSEYLKMNSFKNDKF